MVIGMLVNLFSNSSLTLPVMETLSPTLAKILSSTNISVLILL